MSAGINGASPTGEYQAGGPKPFTWFKTRWPETKSPNARARPEVVLEYLASWERHREIIDGAAARRAARRSPRWQELRRAAKARAGMCCERCGQKGGPRGSGRVLDVHHKTYERLGAELLEDVEVLCQPCHLGEHGITR